ncbi:MAG TPA: carboxypeptidase regulatory-like domain-containing protein [Thermoplasmata archaeon]|nr:carboxypeptidase regulatory-like domain-containing protein [Thermoplasmata archaeon]
MRQLPVILALALVLVVTGSARAAEIHGTVTQAGTETPLSGINVDLYEEGGTSPLRNATTDANGTYGFSGLDAGSYYVEVRAPGYALERLPTTISTNGSVTVDVGLRQHPAASQAGFPFIGTLSAVVLTTSALAMGLLFARIHRNDLLQHAVRQRLYAYVRANPGKHYRGLLNELQLPMGVLTYHLNTLERGGYITSTQDGVYRRFFVAGTKAKVQFFLTEIQQRIVLALRENSGVSQAALAESTGISRSLVNYHLHILRDAGLVRIEPRGRETGCYLVQS